LVEVWVDQATGLFGRATSPTIERMAPVPKAGNFRPLDAAASCRRERPSWPFHPNQLNDTVD